MQASHDCELLLGDRPNGHVGPGVAGPARHGAGARDDVRAPPPLPPRKILAAHRPSAARLMSVVAALDALKEAASSNRRWLTAA